MIDEDKWRSNPAKYDTHPAPLAPHEALLTGHFRRNAPYGAYREKGTADWLLILTLDGAGCFQHAGGGETVVRAHDIVLLPPRTLHDYDVAPVASLWELLWTHFHPRPDWHEWMHWPEAAPGFLRLALTPEVGGEVAAAFHAAHRLATGALPYRELLAMNALESVLLWCAVENTRQGRPEADARVQAVLAYMLEHLGEKITALDLAEHVGLSPSRLTQLFWREMRQTPIHYLETQRLARAQQMLARTTLPVGSIATEVGFDNPFYFTQRFKRHTGLPPTEYRRRSLLPVDGLAEPDERA